ncbi:MAG TPA: HupE/UreJ family protein [Opitutales bacterium]|jgi:hydrogenase/urease accessory protein HupE|nr:HupE/UreJ family protein [Opitutales bacterium]
MTRRIIFILFTLLAMAAAPLAHAHEIRPAYLEFQETTPDTYAVLWKVPLINNAPSGFSPLLPPNAKISAGVAHETIGGTYYEHYTLTIPGGLTGQTIAVTGPAAALADVLVRIVRLDGTVQFLRLTPATPTALVEAASGAWKTGLTFFNLGIQHILMGVDHLLFVLGLLLIVRDRWMLLKTITAFTVAHSITLAVATLGYASAPLPPLNAAIALSILFLGPEIVRVQRGQTSLTIEQPWLVAFAFGLLHGFGFASGLTSLGLGKSEIPWALLSFNIGVEAGQLFFVAVILLLERSFKVLVMQWPRWAQALPGYTVGGLGAYWTIQRVSIMLAGMR